MPSPTIRLASPKDAPAIVDLWKQCELTRPWNDPLKDIQRKLSYQPDLFFVCTLSDKIIGTAMAGYDGHRGSVYYLAVHPEHQRQGIGRDMMKHVESSLTELGCPKINILIRTSNLSVQSFYEQQGYIKDEVISLGKRLIEDI